jgi:hypothetical protein
MMPYWQEESIPSLQADWNPAQLLASLAMPSRLYLEHTLVLGSSG